MNKEDGSFFIRQKCIEANPDLAVRETREFDELTQNDGLHPLFLKKIHGLFQSHIRLADVLLAIKTKYPLHQLQVSEIAFGKTDEGMWIEIAWNLRADDLREQSEETINFLYDLLQ